MTENNPSLSVLISCKNNADVLDFCLKRVVSVWPLDKEVIVIDAHSTDETGKILKGYDNVKVVYDDGSTLSNARNLGLKNASGEIVAYLDPDVLVEKDHFKKFLQCYAEHPEVGAVGTDGKNWLLGNKVQQLESLYYKVDRGISGRKPESWLGGFAFSFRREALLKMGGFTSFMRSDDNDINRKMDILGVKHRKVVTDTWHVPRASLSAMVKEQFMWGRNAAEVILYYGLATNGLKAENRKLARLTKHPVLLPILIQLNGPFAAVRMFYKTRKLSLFAYALFRSTVNLAGCLRGLKVRWKNKCCMS